MSKSRKSAPVSGGRRFLIFILQLIGATALVFIDQALKNMAAAHKGEADRVLIKNILALTYTENSGAAFSILEGAGSFLNIIVIILLSLLVITLATGFVHGKIISGAVVMIIAGGAANLVDRIRLGFVIDYIKTLFIDFPVFNFADILITVGVFIAVIWLIASMIREHKEKPRRKKR